VRWPYPARSISSLLSPIRPKPTCRAAVPSLSEWQRGRVGALTIAHRSITRLTFRLRCAVEQLACGTAQWQSSLRLSLAFTRLPRCQASTSDGHTRQDSRLDVSAGLKIKIDCRRAWSFGRVLTATAIQRTTATHGRPITATHVIGRAVPSGECVMSSPGPPCASRPGGSVRSAPCSAAGSLTWTTAATNAEQRSCEPCHAGAKAPEIRLPIINCLVCADDYSRDQVQLDTIECESAEAALAV
jgi:hypothetical protein